MCSVAAKKFLSEKLAVLYFPVLFCSYTVIHSALNAEIILAVGGPTESPEFAINQGWDYVNSFGASAASFAIFHLHDVLSI